MLRFMCSKGLYLLPYNSSGIRCKNSSNFRLGDFKVYVLRIVSSVGSRPPFATKTSVHVVVYTILISVGVASSQ